MKSGVLTILILLVVLEGSSQHFQPTKFSSAVIVSDLSKSTEWYKNLFGLQLKNEMNDPNGSYKISILESGDFLLELLQLSGSLPQADILKSQPDGTKIRGHFKIGFEIKNMDGMLAYLKKANIEVARVWTDSKTRKRNFLISDPDGNLIQFFEN